MYISVRCMRTYIQTLTRTHIGTVAVMYISTYTLIRAHIGTVAVMYMSVLHMYTHTHIHTLCYVYMTFLAMLDAGNILLLGMLIEDSGHNSL